MGFYLVSIALSLLVDKCAIHCASFEWQGLPKEGRNKKNLMKTGWNETDKRSEIKRFARTNQVVERAKEKKKSCGETEKQPRAQTACPFFFYFKYLFFYTFGKKKQLLNLFLNLRCGRVWTVWWLGEMGEERKPAPPHHPPTPSPYKCENWTKRWKRNKKKMGKIRIKKKKTE